jgi:hypothetical protein
VFIEVFVLEVTAEEKWQKLLYVMGMLWTDKRGM